jgi:radical SAM superfamily enzyme YgiQ (UPF0313 family)
MSSSIQQPLQSDPAPAGKLIVITAPLTESIDHAGYFVQMGMASMPTWMEKVMDGKWPNWREVERFEDGSAKYLPAGARILETSLQRIFDNNDIVACYPDDLPKFIGPRTRVVAVSTHNPLGVTFAAGIYASLFGSTREPVNAFYTRKMFETIKQHPCRSDFKVIVGGSGGWQIAETDSYERLGIDCIVGGRSESEDVLDLFQQAVRGEEIPRDIEVAHPELREEILFSDKRTTFGVVEMTTGCGRRCKFCLPDLSPQIDMPRDRILEAVQANVRNGNKQISLATEDMFIWGQVHTETPFYFPNREAILDLYQDIADTPGVEEIILSHSTMAPAVVDPVLIERLSDILQDKSPIHLPVVSSHPKKKVLSPLLGLETASIPMARRIMPSKGVPFSIEDWPSVVLEGLRIMNENNWFPMITLMVGAPEETDEDVKATIDFVYEMERRKLFGFLVPSIFTPLHDTRMAHDVGVTRNAQLTPLQWQLIMKCWKINTRPGSYAWWAPLVWKLGAFGMWLYKLRRLNGPNSKWAFVMFSSLLPETLLARMSKIYRGKPLKTKSREELIASLKPQHRRFIREDTCSTPEPRPDLPLSELEGVAAEA